jgi:hypothetical protein
LAIVVVVLAGGYVAVDVAATTIAKNYLAHAIRSRTAAKSAVVQIDSVPFLYDAIVHGTVHEVDAQVVDVHVDKLELARVAIVARDVQVDRHLLLADRRLHVTGITSAEIRVTVTAAELSQRIGHEVVLDAPDTIKVKIGPFFVPATIRIVQGHLLSIGEGGLRLLDVNLAANPAIPRCDMHLTVTRNVATLECQLAPVPPSLLAGASAHV